MKRINIIGTGRVGRTMLRLLGPSVGDVSSRTSQSARNAVSEAGHGQATVLKEMRPADIWLLTVPDAKIETVACQLAESAAPPATAIHCSGFCTADIMAPLQKNGWSLASAHPNLSFADPLLAANAFDGTPVGLEGEAAAVQAADTLFASLGAVTFSIPSENKALYHAAAVFSNNFATVLQSIARDAWRDAGVPTDLVPVLNETLLNATAENVARLGPQAALTGPAARGDTDVVAAQQRSIEDWKPEVAELYRTLSKLAESIKGRKK